MQPPQIVLANAQVELRFEQLASEIGHIAGVIESASEASGFPVGDAMRRAHVPTQFGTEGTHVQPARRVVAMNTARRAENPFLEPFEQEEFVWDRSLGLRSGVLPDQPSVRTRIGQAIAQGITELDLGGSQESPPSPSGWTASTNSTTQQFPNDPDHERWDLPGAFWKEQPSLSLPDAIEVAGFPVIEVEAAPWTMVRGVSSGDVIDCVPPPAVSTVERSGPVSAAEVPAENFPAVPPFAPVSNVPLSDTEQGGMDQPIISVSPSDNQIPRQYRRLFSRLMKGD
jgi:hypothetical protein